MKRSDLMDVIISADAAIQNVLEGWENGDLAAAVRHLKEVRDESIHPAIEWWNSDEG
jgi:hypothetical protein